MPARFTGNDRERELALERTVIFPRGGVEVRLVGGHQAGAGRR
jgi:hypothetical protein